MKNNVRRLKRQIDYLAQFNALPFKIDPDEQDFLKLINDKFRLMKYIKATALFNTNRIITNLGLESYPDVIPFSKIHSVYNGQDLGIGELKKNDFFYRSPSDFFYMLRSGQSAVIITWLYLFEVFGNVRIMNPSSIYHESISFYNYMQRRVSGTQANVLYIDSQNWSLHQSEEFKAIVSDAKFVIIDSTCWEMNGVEMDFFFETMKPLSIPYFVIRSHLKLDTLGAEYGLLGSVFVYGTQDEKSLARTRAVLLKLISTTRSAAVYDELYPFLGGGQFPELVSERIKSIKKNTEWISKKINQELGDLIQVENFHHGLYSYLHVGNSEAKKNLLKILELDENSLIHADSFGFDRMTVSFVYPEDLNIWRVCGSDMDHQAVEESLEPIFQAIRKTVKF